MRCCFLDSGLCKECWAECTHQVACSQHIQQFDTELHFVPSILVDIPENGLGFGSVLEAGAAAAPASNLGRGGLRDAGSDLPTESMVALIIKWQFIHCL